MTSLPRWPALWPHAWLAPAIAAAVWSIALAGAEALAVQRSLVFLGGPLVLLAGLHARLGEYLHGRAREQLAALPIAPERHFAAGSGEHRRGLAAAAGCGLAGIAVGCGGDGWRTLVLAGDFAWLCVIAAAVEPVIPAVGAFAGRRFPEDHWLRQTQRQLGGGWTTPEATVHLYGPAFGLALAVALAMPGQLALAQVADGRAWTGDLAALLVVPLIAAIGLRIAAPRIYAAGFFSAVAWLAEATRSLAGPPEPPPRPAWLGRVGSPVLRLWLTQWLRLTALPVLRGVVLVAWALYLGLRAAPPTAPTIALGLALAALWLMPLQALARARRRSAAMLVRLPVSPSLGATAAALFAGPPLALGLAIGARVLGG
ncbi:MAG: hypothetical protein JNL82_10740 [Myxococcales bacterium]|nr:hypothetical protein [Myxococcales bacterium]